MVQIGDLAQKLGDVASEVSDMINGGLELLMTDVPSFVSFASTGAWSGGYPYSLPKTVKGLDLALKTFLVSTAISKNLKSKTLVGVSIHFTVSLRNLQRLHQETHKLTGMNNAAAVQGHLLWLRLR